MRYSFIVPGSTFKHKKKPFPYRNFDELQVDLAGCVYSLLDPHSCIERAANQNLPFRLPIRTTREL